MVGTIRFQTKKKKAKTMNPSNPATSNQPTSPKQRHGCLTAYLVLMLLANSGTALVYLVASESVRQGVPNMPDWAFPVLIAGSLLNFACAIALFKWKRWGFWGFVVTAAIAFGINLSIGLGIGSALGGLVGVAILYGVLQLGKEKSGWSQLE